MKRALTVYEQSGDGVESRCTDLIIGRNRDYRILAAHDLWGNDAPVDKARISGDSRRISFPSWWAGRTMNRPVAELDRRPIAQDSS